MSYLLDTQIVWWIAFDDPRLRPVVTEKVLRGRCWVSVASLWELAIKRSIGKLKVEDDFVDWPQAQGFELLPIELKHVWATRDFPLHHRDPFDRLLAAQAIAEGLTLVTSDPALSLYGCDILRV